MVLTLKILVFNAGKLASIEGAVVRFKHLIIERGFDKVIWVDPVSSRAYYKTEDLDLKVPKNVELVKGGKCASNPVLELIAREKHFLKAAKRYAGEVDAAVFYNSWGTLLARNHLKNNGVPLVFDYIDLMHAFRKNPLERAVAWKSTVQAFKQSDLVLTTARKLQELAKRYNKNSVLIPNGVDCAKLAKVKPKKIKRPAVGFVGGFGDWVDFTSVMPAVRELKNVRFYFIGDGVQKKFLETQTKDKGLKNVFISDGFIPYDEAKSWMAAFDACLIPFKLNELTDAVCPLKLFEYWALKRPTVCTPTYEIKNIATRGETLFAKTPGEWTEKIELLLKNKSLARKTALKGFAKAKEHDWRLLSKKYRKALEGVAKCR
ncbi:glycosyltransferase [Candidatus Micrarchaeota archaeon]|nr:glycosyltransferase [Candidatus Micrarchaeota archaeon]